MAVEVILFWQGKCAVHEKRKAHWVRLNVLFELELDQVQKLLVLLPVNLVPDVV